MQYGWRRVPILRQLNLLTVYEHTPLAPWRYGEYPRFIRQPGAHQGMREGVDWEWKRVPLTPGGQ